MCTMQGPHTHSKILRATRSTSLYNKPGLLASLHWHSQHLRARWQSRCWPQYEVHVNAGIALQCLHNNCKVACKGTYKKLHHWPPWAWTGMGKQTWINRAVHHSNCSGMPGCTPISLISLIFCPTIITIIVRACGCACACVDTVSGQPANTPTTHTDGSYTASILQQCAAMASQTMLLHAIL
jgi:hypothetical protein